MRPKERNAAIDRDNFCQFLPQVDMTLAANVLAPAPLPCQETPGPRSSKKGHSAHSNVCYKSLLL